jgi:hypothetical protein
MSIDEERKQVQEKFKRSWNKLCPEAQKLMQEKYLSALMVLQ